MPKTPFDYQNVAIEWGRPRDNVAYFLQQRLGKSLVFLRWKKDKPTIRRTLIVCPLSVINSWEKELKDEGIAGVYLRSSDKNKAFWSMYKQIMQANAKELDFVCVTNYECVSSSDILEWGWDCVCLDEATRIRKHDNNISRHIIEHTKEVPHKVILTGKPAPESLIDYFNQMKFLNGQFLGEDCFYKFRAKYFPNHTKYSKVSKFTKKAITEEIERNAFTLRREDVNIGSHTFYQSRTVELPPDLREIYDAVEKDAMAKINAGGEEKLLKTNWIIVAQNWLHQLTGGCPTFLPDKNADHKVKEILNLVNGELKDEKIIIWCRFRREIEHVTRELRESGHNALMIYGSTSLEDRGRFIDAFQTKPQYKFLVCQIKTAQQGLDLSASSTAIYYSNSWENECRSQSVDRFIHPTKTTPCLVIDLVVNNSIDQDILNALAMKDSNTEIFQGNIFQNFIARLNSSKVGDL